MLALNTAILAALLFSTGPVSDESETLPEGHATTASLGHPYHGRLRDGIRLPFKGAFHTVQRSTRNRGWVYGTGYLVRGILTSARTVHQMMPPGQPLVLGNLSRRGGGDINMSMSHNSGRDVDMAYYTVDPKGQSVESRYHRFGPDGRSRKAPSRYQLDLPRNWAFVKSLLINQEFEIQWVIVAPWIERLMVKHARSAGEHPDTIRQVQRLMMQPSWAKPHDNHIHVRVLCSPEDWGKRCKNAGPVWPWNTRMLQAMDAARARIAPRLASADTRTRLDALKELRERGVDTAVLAASALLSDRELSVRKEALETVLALTTEATAVTILKTARWMEAQYAVPLIEHALPLSGIDGLAEARALLAKTHPVLSETLRRKVHSRLVRLAQKLVDRFGDQVAFAPNRRSRR